MKNKEVREIILKTIIGFPIGVTLLMLAYIGIYFIAGQNVFENEINQLKDVRILIEQVVVSGISWYIFLVGFRIFNRIEGKDMRIIDIVVKTIAMVLSLCLFFVLNDNAKFSENVLNMNCIIVVIVYALLVLINIIKRTIDQYVINKKIKEINKI